MSGFDLEMVRRSAAGGETKVLLSDHYLHHYILHFGEMQSMLKMFEAAARDPHTAHTLTGCHGMKGAAVRQLQAQMAEEGGPGAGLVGVDIGSAAGAEYRHNPQRWLAPYRLLLRKPEVWSPTLHIINTNRRSNSTSGGDGKLLTECPCTPQRKIDVAAGTIDGRRPDPPIGCSAEFAATGNPSCHLSTYQGGWRCCEHGVFLIDTAKECSTPDCSEKFQDEVYMKFTFYYADAGPE